MEQYFYDATVNIKIKSISVGSCNFTNKDTIVACIGSTKNFFSFKQEISYEELCMCNNVWQFRVNSIEKASFIVVIFKKRLIGHDQELGRIHLRCNAFERNTVVSHSFDLQSTTFYSVKPRITLDVHVDDEGSEPFLAIAGCLSDDYLINHNRIAFSL